VTADCFIAFTGPSVFGCPLSISQPPIVSVDSPIVAGHERPAMGSAVTTHD